MSSAGFSTFFTSDEVMFLAYLQISATTPKLKMKTRSKKRKCMHNNTKKTSHTVCIKK